LKFVVGARFPLPVLSASPGVKPPLFPLLKKEGKLFSLSFPRRNKTVKQGFIPDESF